MANGGSSEGAMAWPRLMSARRLKADGQGETDGHRSPFETDGDRIAFSNEWRRAAAKTQVHDPDPAGVPVRTRGTHSLEVSRVARSVGQMAGHIVVQRHGLEGTVRAEDIAHAAAAAGLAHDLGNPPFGHAGEDVIAAFFRSGPGAALIAPLSSRLRHEFLNVDGNAQGFRIVTRLTGWRLVGGLQLTCATLAAQVKYPFQAADSIKPGKNRKYGFYASEAGLFREVAEEVGLVEAAPGRWCRHPLVYMLEASDDLCYLVVDTVDAALVGDLSFVEAVDLLTPLIPEIGPEFREVPGPERKLEYLQSRAIGRLVKDAASAFLDAEAAILEGRQQGDLLSASPVADHLRRIAEVAKRKVYRSPRRIQREARGKAILEALLEDIAGAMLCWERLGPHGLPDDAEDVLWRVWRPHELADMPTDRYGWLRGMVDTVMGMTDARAAKIALGLRPGILAGEAPEPGAVAAALP